MKKNLKKYREIMKISFKNSLQYRAEMFLWFVIDGMPILSMIILWIAVYSQQGTISGYSLTDMLTYYIIGYFAHSLIAVHMEEHWLEEIRKGEVSFILLKPFSFKVFATLGEVAWKIMNIFFIVLPLLTLVSIFSNILFLPTLPQAVALLAAIAIGFIIDSLLCLMIIAGGFVFDQAHSLSHLKWMLVWIFSGSMLPYELMPGWLASIAKFFPFQFLYTTPVKLYTNFSPEFAIKTLSFAFVWMLALYVILQQLWKITIKKYSAVGN